VPGSATAPGPGRSANALRNPTTVGRTQNTEASVAFAGTFVKTIPAGAPVSLIVRQAVLPKQPNRCPPVLV
jgi:hypothetical protein